MVEFLGQQLPPLGMGCWQIGGAMYAGDTPLGYTRSEDGESIRTVHAAYDAGIRIFDTAAAYGAGHSERLLGEALGGKPDALIVTKIGIAIDEKTRQLTGAETDAGSVIPAIEASAQRLGRDCIDLVLMHQNTLPVEEALPFFDAMERAVEAGKIRAYGWSTDFSASVEALAARENFAAVEHGMNVFIDVPRIQATIDNAGLNALIRSPLAMGLLSGKYDGSSVMQPDDIRANAQLDWARYYKDGRPNPEFLKMLDGVRELLTVGGRSLVEGALCWLWAKRADNIPVPGARTAAQIEGLAAALSHGPLPADVMAKIETLVEREPPDAPDRER